MSCCQLQYIKNPHYSSKPNGYYQFWKQYLEVPCGWCLNCRVDKQNWISDACQYEWKKYDYIASFVTFTYDDIHIQYKDNIIPDDFFSFKNDEGKIITLPFLNNKPVEYSLHRDDARAFLKRLRSKISYLYKKHKIKNIDLCRKDFAFIQAGEYGDLFGRPHYHFVFFGLDWQFCKELFEDCWQQGLIDVKPVQEGAFEYVSKYFTKQQIGKRAVELYDNNNLERPYFVHSLGLGKGLILEQLDFIRSHNACYLNNNDVLRPIPIYYRNFFHLRSIPVYDEISNQMLQAGISPDRNYSNSNIRYSLKKMNEFKKAQAILRHKKLENKIEGSGQSFEPLIDSYNSSRNIIYELVDEALFYTDSSYGATNFEKFVTFCDKNNYIPF